MSAPDANNPSFAAPIRLEDWSQMSIAQLQSPALLFGAEAEVTSLLTARAASCGTQGACVRDDSQQLFSIGQLQVITVEGSAAIGSELRRASAKKVADGRKMRNSRDQLDAARS